MIDRPAKPRPWQTRAITKPSLDNARKNTAARKKMSELERLIGMTADEYTAHHAEQRARVLARYGLAA